MPAETTVNTGAFARVPNSAAAARLDRAAIAKPPLGMAAPSPGGSAPLLFGPKMRPRDEAVFWLSAAAEIEHALMAQYLFAAYTIDPASTPDENDARRLATAIKNSLLQIAREEMGHFITVQNLLQIVGGPLHFGRQYSPFEAVIQPFRYRLEPLTLDSLAKYVIAESPNRPFSELVLRPDPAQDAALKQKLADDIEPRAIRSNGDVALWHVGAVFKRLSELFQSELDDADLRTDRGGLQAMWADWGYEAPPGSDGKIALVEALTATTASDLRREAVAAIAKIGEQGEAFDAPVVDGDESHFERFLSMYEKLERVEGVLGRPLALPVAANPNTTPAPAPTNNVMLGMGQDHLEAGRISNERALRWAHLFNLRYRILLGCLHHALLQDTPAYETQDGPQKGDRTPKGLLQWWTFSEMRRLKIIAEKLTELPTGDSAGPRAGAPFELPYSLRMPHVDTDRWAIHADVFAMAKAFIDEKMLVAGETGSDFLTSVTQADAQSAAIAIALSRAAPLPAGTHATDFRKFARILDEAVRGFAFRSPHGPFWRNATRAAVVDSGRIVPNDPDASNLLSRIARGQSEEGGMPRERPRIAPERVEFVRDWIARGAPDNVPEGEVGVTSEPVPPREPVVTPPPAPVALLSFAQDIKPLFRDRDRNRMLFRFDLFLFDDVKQNAADILDAVSSGRMPCDVPWDSSKVATFKKWMDDGLLS